MPFGNLSSAPAGDNRRLEVPTRRESIRALHVVGSLGRGGAETWLAQTVPHLIRREVRVDVATVGAPTGPCLAPLLAAGCRIFPTGKRGGRIEFARVFPKILKSKGPYQVVHSHLQLFSGLVLRLAEQAGVPVRIAHSRNSSDGRSLSPGRRIYRRLMLRWLERHASGRLAVSRQAALGGFGPRLGSPRECGIMTGLELEPFRKGADSAGIRRSLGIDLETPVAAHVGSFTSKKNHAFLLDVTDALLQRNPKLQVLLVGTGPLAGEMERRARRGAWGHCYRFLGDRPDVPQLLMGAVDVLLLPSRREGLPRVILEAQAAGVPCVVSSEVTREAASPFGWIRFLDLSDPPLHWCEAVEEALCLPSKPSGRAAVRYFESLGYTVSANGVRLAELYRRLLLEVPA